MGHTLTERVQDWLGDVLHRLGSARAPRNVRRWALHRSARVRVHDWLTGVLTRSEFVHRISRLPGLEGELVLLDIDSLKMCNDALGHERVDEILRRYARAMEQAAPGCWIARLGGDEFIVYVPRDGDAQGVAERIRSLAVTGFAAERAEVLENQPPEGRPPLTATVTYTRLRAGDTLAEAVRRLDEVLFRLKKAGGNAVSEA